MKKQYHTLTKPKLQKVTVNESTFDKMRKRNLSYHKLAPEFFRVFHFQLSRYTDLIIGFDVIKLDEDLHTPEGMSTADIIQERYGKEGFKLVKELMAL